MIYDLIKKNRSYRRFDQSYALDEATLKELVELGRLSPSAANLQPLKYYLSWQPEKNTIVFEHLVWAGYLTDWDGPMEGERPSGHIIILGDKRISQNFGCDHGIVAQSILLGAVEKGLGGCMIGSIKREGLYEKLGLDRELEILLVVALGKPVETVVLDEIGADGSIKYWRDDKQVHHVPKRSLEEVVIS
jgi:nitroreductase